MSKRINPKISWRFLLPFFTLYLLVVAGTACSDPKKKAADPSLTEREVIYQDWPIFRRDPELQGESIEDLKLPLELAWTFKPPIPEGGRSQPIEATAVISEGVVYVGNVGGRFFALNLENGQQVWEFKAQGTITGPAAVFGARVFFGDTSGTFYALNTEDGTEAWSFKETGDAISGGANVLESSSDSLVRVFFGSDDYSLYCLNASTGEFLWKHETENKVVATPSLITSADHPAVSFGGCDGNLHILSADGKGEPRSIEVGSYITNSSCVRDGIAYIAHDGGEVVAVVIENGEIAWRIQTGDEYRGAGAVGEKLLYIPGKGKKLTAYHRSNGEIVWEFQGRRSFDSSPVLTASAVWQAGGDGVLYAVDPQNGTELWHWETGTKMKSSPAISRGFLVISGEDGSVYAFRSVAETSSAK